MYTLYSYPASQHSRRVAALLEEAGIDYENRIVDLEADEHMSPEFLAINPNHQVPTLVDGDLIIHESNAILRYLCNRHGLEDWYPSDPAVRARVDQWLDWNQCLLGGAVVNVVLYQVFMPELGKKDRIEEGRRALQELFPILGEALSLDPFLCGRLPTIADLSVAANISHLWFADVTSDDARIAAWMDRVCDIPGFKKVSPAPLMAA